MKRFLVIFSFVTSLITMANYSPHLKNHTAHIDKGEYSCSITNKKNEINAKKALNIII